MKIVIVALITFGLSGCYSEEYSWHQKLTVVVGTPDGDAVASSVIAVKATSLSGPLVFQESRGVGTSMQKGEGVVVDLGSGRYLFALLSNGRDGQRVWRLARKVFGDQFKTRKSAGKNATGNMPWPKWAQILEQLRGERRVSSEHYPMLVTFGDITDPLTITKVDAKNLSASFGKGYRLKSITLEMTDAPVSDENLGKVLGWLKGMGDSDYVHGRNLSKGTIMDLQRDNFVY